MHPFKLTGFYGRLSVIGSSKMCLVFALFLRFRVPSFTFFFQVGNVLGFCCLWPFCFFSASFLLTCFRPKSSVEGGGRYVTPPFF